jgi:hypothetical protein
MMNHNRSFWLVSVLAVLLFLANVELGPRTSWAQTVPPPPVHPLYGECEENPGGTVPAPSFEPFLPNSIYVDWCGHARLTIAPPDAEAASVSAARPGFDAPLGQRIGFFYTTQTTDTGWFIASYSYRIDFTDLQDLEARITALLRELCPQGNICNELLVAEITKLGAEQKLINAAGKHQLDSAEQKLFVPYVSK